MERGATASVAPLLILCYFRGVDNFRYVLK